jgi:hypothetical protein
MFGSEESSMELVLVLRLYTLDFRNVLPHVDVREISQAYHSQHIYASGGAEFQCRHIKA